MLMLVNWWMRSQQHPGVGRKVRVVHITVVVDGGNALFRKLTSHGDYNGCRNKVVDRAVLRLGEGIML